MKDVTTHPAFRNTVPHGGTALRRPARPQARRQDHGADRHRQRRQDPRVLQGAEDRSTICWPGRNAIAEWAKITYGWLGRSPDYKASFLATLGANAEFYDPYTDNARRWYKFSQERVPFVNHAIIHPPVDRDRPPSEVARHLLSRREGDRRRHRRVRRQGGGDRLGADQLHLRRPSRPASRCRTRNSPWCSWCRPITPGVKFICRTSYEMTVDGDGQPVRLSAVEPHRRERRGVHPRQGFGALGERVRLWRHGEGQQFLPAHRLPAALRRARLHAARGQARLHRRAAAEGGRGLGHQGLSRRAGQCRRGHRLAQSVLGAVGRHGARSEAVDRRLCAAEHGSGQRLSDHRHHRLYQGQIHHRADGGVRPHLSQLARQRLQKSPKSGRISTATCAAPTATRPRSASS